MRTRALVRLLRNSRSTRSVLSNVTTIFSDARVCQSTLALRYMYAMFKAHEPNELVVKQMALLRVPTRSPIPSAVASRPTVLIYSVDLCLLRAGTQRTLATEASALRDTLSAAVALASRSVALLLLTNVVQFCIEVERYKLPHPGIVGYNGAAGCAVSLCRFIERALVVAAPANVALHVAAPKCNSRYDFTQASAPFVVCYRFAAPQQAAISAPVR